MGHGAFVDDYKKPNFRLHLIILLTIVGVSVFLSTQVEKSKEKTRIEALKIPVPIDSVFVDEDAQKAKPRVETPKVADASSAIIEPEVEYRFENGPNLSAIDSMLASVDEPVSDVDGVLSAESSEPANQDHVEITKSDADIPATEETAQRLEKEQDVAIMVTDDMVSESVQNKSVDQSLSDSETANSNISESKNTEKTVAKMDAVYESQQDRFLKTLAKTASQQAEESVEVKRMKEAIRSDKPLKLKSTVKATPVTEDNNEIVKVASTTSSGVIEKKVTKNTAKQQKNLVIAKKSETKKADAAKSITDPVRQITLTKSELNNVLAQFARSYNKGDIKRLMALFDENAVTNDQKSKLGIKAEYDELFKTTSNRQIKIRNIQWSLNSDKAKGDARFTVTVQPLGSAESAQIEGKIEILAVKEDRGVFIKRLLHQVTR